MQKNVKKQPSKLVNIVLIILGLILIFPLIRFLQRQLARFDKNNATIEEIQAEAKKQSHLVEISNPKQATTLANSITTSKSVQSAAQKLTHLLGTKYSDNGSIFNVLDPRGWTENDNEVSKLLIYQRNNYLLIKRLYNEVYSNSRSLSHDLFKLLDNDNLAKVQKYINI